MDFLKQNNFRYIVIIIIIILAVINLCKINSQENFANLTEDQNLGPSFKVNMNSTDQVMFGTETLTHKLTNLDTLTVAGSANFSGVDVEGNLRVGNDLTVDGNINLNYNSEILGKSSMSVAAQNGNIILMTKSTDNSKGQVRVALHQGGSGDLWVENDLTVFQNVKVHHGYTDVQNLRVRSYLTVDDDLTVMGATTVKGDLIVQHGYTDVQSLRVRSYLTVDGATTVEGDLTVDGIAQGNAFTNLSDRRLKENIKNISQNDKDKVLQLVPKTYNMIDDDKKSKRYGLIAQEVEELYPEFVNTNETDGMKSLNYIELIPLLLEQIKELKKSVPNQETVTTNVLNIGGVTLTANELLKLKQLINM